MSRARPPQLAFSSGEISPLLQARTDYQRFQTGLRSCVGYLPLRQGGVTRAPGTIYRGTTRNNAKARLIPFEFAVNDALTLEFTDGYMRVWRYGALVEVGGAPFELAVPYDAAAIGRLSWVQSADVIYLADGQLPIQKLSRFALDDWSIEPAVFVNGPFRVQNLDEAKTMLASATTGDITITGTGDIFSADWVGSLIQLKPDGYEDIPLWTSNTDVSVGDLMRNAGNIYRVTSGANTGAIAPVHEEGVELVDKTKGTRWAFVSDGTGVVRVTGYTDANSVDAEVLKDLPPPVQSNATYRWAEGAWSARRGYPAQLEIDDQSLVAGFTPEEPRTLWYLHARRFRRFRALGGGGWQFRLHHLGIHFAERRPVARAGRARPLHRRPRRGLPRVLQQPGSAYWPDHLRHRRRSHRWRECRSTDHPLHLPDLHHEGGWACPGNPLLTRG